MRLLRRLPFRRVELLFSLLLLAVCFGLISGVTFGREFGIPTYLALIGLEMLLPLSMGVVAAGLFAGDPALDLVLSAPMPAWRVLGERVLLLGGSGAGLGVGFLLLAQQRELVLPRKGLEQVLIWLSPMVFCIGLSSAVALLRGRMLDGVVVTAVAMIVALITLMPVFQWCALNSFQAGCPLWLANPLMTLGNSQDEYWLFNRLLWLAFGICLLGWCFRLVQREEPLLEDRDQE